MISQKAWLSARLSKLPKKHVFSLRIHLNMASFRLRTGSNNEIMCSNKSGACGWLNNEKN